MTIAVPFPVDEADSRWEELADEEYASTPEALLERAGARVLADIEARAPLPLLCGRWSADAHSILYGTGGVGKGTFTAAEAVALAAEGHRVLIVDYEDHRDEWAGRGRALGGVAPLASILYVAPLGASWTLRRGPLWDQAAALRELADLWEASFVIIDSIVVACGGADPMDPGTPARYAGALQQLGRPVLSLAHVTKEGDLRYPFGSVFWHNLARVTWSMEADGDRVQLVNRKSNQHERAGRLVVETTYLDGLPREVAVRPYSAVLAERIRDVVGAEPLSVAAIVDALNEQRSEGEQAVKVDSVRHALRRGLTEGRYAAVGTGKDVRWTLR